MKRITKTLCLSLITGSLIGCASGYKDNSRLCAKDNGDFYQCKDLSTSVDRTLNDPSLFDTELHFQLLGEYTEQMAADMQSDLSGVEIKDPIIVSPFVYFNKTRPETSTLGNQIAEYFINDLQAIGLPVSDHKLTGMLTVNKTGNYTQGKNLNDFSSQSDAGYALVGTMIPNKRGLVVNARIVSVKTNIVVASSSKFLPNIVDVNLQ